MTLLPSLIAFTGAASLLTVTPGPDSALILRTAAIEGPRTALMTGIGILLGCAVWGLAAAVGLGALLAASETAYTVLRWIGAAYLLWLGLKLLIAPRRVFDADAGARAAGTGRAWLARGFLTNILNPKVGLFYVSFLPQFIPAGADVVGVTLAMTAIHAGLTVLWFALLTAATAPLAGFLRRRGVVTWLDRITGGLFVGFAVKLALDSRR